ncbi:HNH endonuclease [Methylobacterium frigidaeris]|uniref:HNH nuclease domain-containing protein n=1 Tax=Methylobacterium frigidaeris TaxID=2038277 RepID=A0AA37HHD3_9HYPH|nr:HNH endonuclease signature motif containing protein [Methylobacterium frigidaeris]PIK73869.1 HNH endonuclease [Methylobacterium frigidaeris]GJD65205.1 hypothetical protein MPEAHAMD_5392 [Methylobacterium frigidaeris]
MPIARHEFDRKTQRDGFLRCGGKCEACGIRLTLGRFQYDHIIPDAQGGDSSLSNLQVLCTDCHKAKTKKDAGDTARALRREDRHFGITPPGKRKIESRGFPKAPPQCTASKPLGKR